MKLKRSGTITLTWDKLIQLWNWNLWNVVVINLTKAKKLKKSTEKKQTQMRNGGVEKGSLSLFIDTTFCSEFFPVLRCISSIIRVTNQMDSMWTSTTFPATSKEPSLDTKWFFTARGTSKKTFLRRLGKYFCLNTFFQGDWKGLVDPMVFFVW